MSSPPPHLEAELERAMSDILNSSISDNSSDLHCFSDDSFADPDFIPPSPKNTLMTTEKEPSATIDPNAALNLLKPRSVLETAQPSKKRRINKNMWKKEVLKKLREQGKEHTNEQGKLIPAKQMKPPKCDNSCNHQCPAFDEENRKLIHDHFWSLTAQEKKNFYAKNVEVIPAKRKRTNSEVSRRQNTFKYYASLGNQDTQYQVCQAFFYFANTLSISQRSIYYFFKNNFNRVTGLSNPPTKGKHPKKNLETVLVENVRSHIQSFPCVDSHYVRAGTQRQFLEAGLSVRKMHRLFCKKFPELEVKYCFYLKIFNYEYNLSFFTPKKDECDTCTKYENEVLLTEVQKSIIIKHKNSNEKAKRRREEDRHLDDNSIAVISYDLQNVFSLPHANTSNFFYKRKFSTYNLTGHCNLNNITYCAIWYETQSGRTGNWRLPALIKILKFVIQDNPQITKIILWSDSCVPQNRNRITSLALLKFLEDNSRIQTIIQKYSEPGHSRIQEVDAVHSTIERHLRNVKYYSPVSLIKQLLSMDYENVHLKVLQCLKEDFQNYNLASLKLNFGEIKYSQAKEIIYCSSNLSSIQYKTDYGEYADSNTVPILANPRKMRNNPEVPKSLPKVSLLNAHGTISNEKKKDIISMLPYMHNSEDVTFYKAVLKIID